MQNTLSDGLINGIGGTIGGGIFLLVGELVKNNRGLSPVAFLVGACICILVAFSYCILSKEFPSDVGTTQYSKEIFKDNKLIQNIITGLICFGYTSLFCIYALSAGNYLGDFIKKPHLSKKFASGIVALCLMLSYMPEQMFNTMQSSFVVFKLSILFLVGIYGIILNSRSTPPNSSNVSKSSLITAMLASLSVFVSFEGFEMNSRYSASMRNTDTNLPLSYFLTIIISAIVYMGLAFSVNKHIGGQITSKNASSSLIDLVNSYGFSSYGPFVIVCTNLLANISAIIATILSISPMLNDYVKDLNMQDTILHEELSLMGSSKQVSVIVACTLAIICIMFGPEEIVKHSGSLSFLMIFGVVCMMAYKTVDMKAEKNERVNLLGTDVPQFISKTLCSSGGVICIAGICVLMTEIMSKG